MAFAPGLLAVSLTSEATWWTGVLALASIYALLGVSLNLINGYGGMFSLGHHGFWALGAYGAAWCAVAWHGQAPGVVVFVLSALVAMAVASLGGILIGVPCLHLRGDYLAIATLGFGEIVRIAVSNSYQEVLGGGRGMEVPRVLMDVSPETRDDYRLLFFVLGWSCVGLASWAIRKLIRSSRGRRLLAVAQDETAASLLGTNPTGPKVTAFVMGSALAGLAGTLHAHYAGVIAPVDFGVMQTVKILLIVVLGGLGSLSGCVLAAIALTVAEQLLSRTTGWVWEWWQVEFALLLILLMIFRPRGLLGGRELSHLWRPRRRVAGGEGIR